GVFRDNIVRMQDLEAEQKRTVADAERTRREQTENLADEFEQAVGAIVLTVSRATEELQGTAKSLTQTADGTHHLANSVAVVASEVKTLAGQTATATEETAAQIADIQSVAKDSIAAIKDIVSVIARVAGIATAITSAVEEQHAATREIAYNVQEAAQGTDNVTEKIRNLEADASETGIAASQVFLF